MFIGGMVTIPKWVGYYCFTRINHYLYHYSSHSNNHHWYFGRFFMIVQPKK